MNTFAQRGASLLEVTIAAAVASAAIGCALAAALPAVRGMTQDAEDRALWAAAQRELRIARDVLKYDGSRVVPSSTRVLLPVPGASPIPAIVSIATKTQAGVLSVSVTAADSRGTQSATARGDFVARAPQPRATIAAPALVPAPTGAP